MGLVKLFLLVAGSTVVGAVSANYIDTKWGEKFKEYRAPAKIGVTAGVAALTYAVVASVLR